MPQLTLTLLGAFQAHLDGIALTNFHSVKVQGLLAYLALEAAQPHTREALMARFWPDDAPQSAQQSLRQALYALRRMVGDADTMAREPFLRVTRQTVQFNTTAAYSLDVATFLQQMTQGRLEQAVALYHGELLAGLMVDSTPFEEWLGATRTYLHNLALNALGQLAQQRLESSDYAQAITYARRQLKLEPWREEAHRQVMTALALSGERSTALAQYESCRRMLAAELDVEPAPETTALYEQIKAGKLRGPTTAHHPLPTARSLLEGNQIGRAPGAKPSPEEEPAAPPVKPQIVRHNLPPQPTPFIGRKTDLEQVVARLHDPTCRLLTIVGPGGMGKTRLALQAAQLSADSHILPAATPHAPHHTPHFTDGVFFIALAGVGSPDLLVSTLATTLGFTFYSGSAPETQLQDYLRAKALLLVLDNCEHLLDGIDLVADLLAVAPEVKVLATSREPLNLREEWLYPLSGMSYPTDKTKPAPLDSYTAVQFFVQCARRMKSDFNLTTESHAVVQICQLVEGMPLGIELAASWLKFYPCTQIVYEMRHSLDFLTTTLRNIPARHRSIRAVFEHSWQLLAVEEQAIFAQLALFRGGFTEPAARQVAGAALPHLLALVEKSLLQLTPDGRFQCHELLRQFAEQRLQQVKDHVQKYHDHAHFYLTLLSEQESQLKGPGIFEAVKTITSELDNIHSAWNWAIEHGAWPAIANALEAFWCFYEIRGWNLEGIEVLNRVVNCLRAMVAQEGTNTAVSAELALLLGRVLCYFGGLGAPLGRHAHTEATLRESLTWLAKVQPPALRDSAVALAYLGAIQGWQGRSLEAIPIVEESAANFRAMGDRWGYAIALQVLSQLHAPLGRYSEAERLAEASNALFIALDEQYYSVYNLDTLGHLALARGRYAQAETYFQAYLERHITLGRPIGVAFAYCELGEVARLQGRVDQAERYYRQGMAIGEEIKVSSPIEQAFWGLGCLAEGLGDYTAAQHYFDASQGAHSTLFLATPHSAHPGWVAVALNDLPAATDYFGAVLKRAAALQRAPLALEALVGLAYLYNQAGDHARGAALLALTAHHPALHQETKERIAYVQAALGNSSAATSTTVTTEGATEEATEGATDDFWQTVERLLTELLMTTGGSARTPHGNYRSST